MNHYSKKKFPKLSPNGKTTTCKPKFLALKMEHSGCLISQNTKIDHMPIYALHFLARTYIS